MNQVINSCTPKKSLKDNTFWKWDESEGYKVKSVYEKLLKLETIELVLPKSITDFIWKTKVPPRAQFIVWLLALKKLKTGSLLVRAGVINSELALCPFCNEVVERVQHLFFEYRVTWLCWMKCLEWWGIQGVLHSDPSINMNMWNSLCIEKKKTRMWYVLFFYVAWTIDGEE